MIFITESRLHSRILDTMICNHEFIVMHDDRCYGKGPGGGVLLLYYNTLKITRPRFKPPVVDENKHFEFLSVDVYINAHNIVRLPCFYIPHIFLTLMLHVKLLNDVTLLRIVITFVVT